MKTKILSPLRRDGIKAGMMIIVMALSAMLLTTACSNQDDIANTSNITSKGYALPVTVSATRQGDATTRATYNESTKKLEFSSGDKLFVSGQDNGGAESFAGVLDYVPATGNFSGTIYTQNQWLGTADALFTAANSICATLLPNGYDANGSNSFLYVDDNNTTDIAYDDVAFARTEKAFVASETAKATGVEQLSREQALDYSSSFALAPQCAILNFTISGLAVGAQNVTLKVTRGTDYTITGSVTPNAGVATFAIGVPVGANIKEGSNNLTVGSSNFTLPSSTTFAAGKIYNITRSAAVPTGALSGEFSVSATKTVYFSKGNLRYASGTWSFFDNQYDYYTSYSADAWDKFGWSTSATTYGMNTSTSSSAYSGVFADWGNNSELQSALGTGWFTLSSAEWTYLFNTRSASTVGGTEDGRYAKAKVNNVQGVILFPDTYTHPGDVTAPTGVNSTDATGWNGNNYNSADWTKMESAGCVFLPAAGFRNGLSVTNPGTNGNYWSATASNVDNAYCVYFGSGYLFAGNNSRARNFGFSVRLVRNAN